MTIKNILIDTDVGLDDALAIMMLLKAHEKKLINIVGITCVDGNTSVDNACINARRVLNLLKFNNIPLFRGLECPLVMPFIRDKKPLHGNDGFGDVLGKFEEPLGLSEEIGACAMIRLAREYKGNFTIFAIGPLGNLALATKIDPKFKNNVTEIYIMGGNTEGVGNVKVTGEFNFAWDPESAYICLNSFKCPMYIVPLETCRKYNFSYEWRKEKLGKLNTPESKFLNFIEDPHLEELCNGPRGWIPYDQLASALLIEPKIGTEFRKHYCTVETKGEYSRGMMIVDYNLHLQKKPNADILTGVDHGLYEKMLIWAAGGPYYK